MKKTSVMLVVLIIAIIIVGAVGIIPLSLFKSSSDLYVSNIGSAESQYQINLKNISGNNVLSDNIKGDIVSMYNSAEEVFVTSRVSYFLAIAYLVVAISVLLIAVGIYFIKNEACKNYVGTSFIVAACMLLAFLAIIGFFILK